LLSLYFLSFHQFVFLFHILFFYPIHDILPLPSLLFSIFSLRFFAAAASAAFVAASCRLPPCSNSAYAAAYTVFFVFSFAAVAFAEHCRVLFASADVVVAAVVAANIATTIIAAYGDLQPPAWPSSLSQPPSSRLLSPLACCHHHGPLLPPRHHTACRRRCNYSPPLRRHCCRCRGRSPRTSAPVAPSP
jgi:hypothetical protein